MSTWPRPPLALLLVATALSCDKDSDTAAAGTCEPSISFADANNFFFVGTLDIPIVQTTADNVDQIQVCWDQVAEDIQCHDVDPAGDVDNVTMIRFTSLSYDEIEDAMATDTLQQSYVSGYVEAPTSGGQTCANFSDMTFLGTKVDITEEYQEGEGPYLLTLNTGTDLGIGVRLLTFLEPTTGNNTSTVDLSSGCDTLDFSVDLTSLTPAPICAGGSSWSVNWQDLTTNGQDLDLQLTNIDSLVVGFFKGLSISDLEGQFLDLEYIADKWYETELEAGVEATLESAVDASGAPFGGFNDTDGIWLVGLFCSTCYNPAPLFLTIVEPMEGA